MAFSFADVQEAYGRISGTVRRTPLEESFFLGGSTQLRKFGLPGTRYFFKLECMQRAKSFKIRGALNKMMTLTEEEKAHGVGTVSSGNHGSSVAYAAQILGIENAVIIVPKGTPQSKIDKIEYFGGKALVLGEDYDEAHALGLQYIAQQGLTYIDPYYDDPKIYGGQGTVAIEILEQNPEIDTLVVPIGGGGLITGIAVAAKALKPGIRVVGVQTQACPAMIKSYEDGVFYDEYPADASVCDALLGGVGALSYQILKDYVDDLIMVSEETIRTAVAFMAKDEKIVAEGGSCTTVAAVMDFAERIGGKNVALVISGGNIDGALLQEILGS